MKYTIAIISLSIVILFSSFTIHNEKLFTATASSEHTLTNITITSPVGGMDYCFKQQQFIEWETTGGTVSTVSIYLMQSDGQTVNRTIASNIANSGSYLWNGFASGLGNYLIKISGTDDATPVLITGQTGVFALKNCLRPDLQIGVMGAIPQTSEVIGEGQRVIYKGEVKNSGENPVQNPSVKMILDRPGSDPTTSFTTQLNVTLGKDQSANFEKGFRVHKAGTYSVTLILDPENTVDEMNESNNRRTRTFEVYPLPDLIVCIDNAKRPPVGREREIQMVVKNIGNSATSPYANCRLRSYVKQKGVKYYDIPALQPGESYTIKRKHKWGTSGTKKLSARISYSQNEIKSENNEVQASFFVRLPHHDQYTAAPKVKCSTGQELYNWSDFED